MAEGHERMPTGERHERIADHLRSAVARRDYSNGEAIPREGDLADRFGVSRAIVRRAIRTLRQEGLLESRRGQGTFVRSSRVVACRWRPDMPRGGPWTTSIATAAPADAIRPLGVEVTTAGRREASWLEIAEGAEVVVRHRHVLDSHGDPVQLYDSYFPLDLVRDTLLGGPGMVHGGVYRALEGMGHQPTEIGEQVAARMPTIDERAVLRLEERTPVLDVVRVTRDQRGRPVEALHIVADGARNVLVYDGLPIQPGKY
ncbi:MAG TPA: GntR family transcriptional regulator [Candidatus Dormibacteraeota bacterium]|nr:GntR family transcriptional regulator [Candidatus Dormibacteraeota bacterium]